MITGTFAESEIDLASSFNLHHLFCVASTCEWMTGAGYYREDFSNVKACLVLF